MEKTPISFMPKRSRREIHESIGRRRGSRGICEWGDPNGTGDQVGPDRGSLRSLDLWAGRYWRVRDYCQRSGCTVLDDTGVVKGER
jgi:hypothetical protein